MNFGVLALIVLAGLAGPLLGAARSAFVPVVIGEVLAGVIVGRTGLDAVDLTDPTVQFLSDVGFAMLMFTVGAHIPLRDPRLPASLRSGAVAAGAVLLLCPLGGVAAAWFAGTGDAAVYAVILGSGSAAAVLTMITEARLTGRQALTVIGQVTIADVVTILAIPLVLRPNRVANAALGVRSSPLGRSRSTSARTGSTGNAGRIASAGARSSAGGRSICVCPSWSCSRCRGLLRRVGRACSSQGSAPGCSSPRSVHPSGCSRRFAASPTGSSYRCSSSSWAPDWSSVR